MRARLAAAFLLLLASAPGCLVVSLQPAYDGAAVAFDEGLVGTWKAEDDETRLELEEAEWRSYKVVLHDGTSAITLTAHLTKVGERELMDVMPLAGVDLPPLALPVHAVYIVGREGDALSTAPLDYDVLRARVEHHALRLPAAIDERQNLVITASAGAFRRWLASDGARGPAFAAPTRWLRVQAG